MLAITLLGGLLGIVAALAAPERYRASAELLIRDSQLSARAFEGPAVIEGQPPLMPDTIVGLLELDQTAGRAAKELDGLTEDEVSDAVEFDRGVGPELIAVTAEDSDPETAAEIANAVTAAFVAFRREAYQDVDATATAAVEAELRGLDPDQAQGSEGMALRRQLRELKTLTLLETGDVEIAAPAEVPDGPVASGVLRNGIVGGIAGFVAGVIATLLLARLRPRVQNRRGFERAYGLSILAELEPGEGLLGPDPADALSDDQREALRGLWTRLRYADPERPIRSLLISSARAGAGVSSTALGLAKVTAAEGFRTAIVDANLREPALASALGIDLEPGLSRYLAGDEHNAPGLVRAVPGSGPGGEGELLGLLPAGATPSNPAGLLGGEPGADLAERLGDDADLVVFDVPALGEIADGLPLIRQVDGVLLVDRPGLTEEEVAAGLVEQLEGFGARLLGVVVLSSSARAG